LATFVVETGLLLYTVIRYKLSPVVRLAAVTLACLALFQLAEYNVCGRLGISAETWSRIGYVAITLLPAMGIHMISLISKKVPRWVVWLVYSLAIVFIVTFVFSATAFENYACSGNYVIFHLQLTLSHFYFAYYYGLLFSGIYLAIKTASQVKKAQRQALLLQA